MIDKEKKKQERVDMYEKYAKRRDELGLTDYEVAKRTGFTRSLFSEWKSGKSMPKIDKMAEIAKQLKVSVNKLIN